jgi:hypothetical protein
MAWLRNTVVQLIFAVLVCIAWYFMAFDPRSPLRARDTEEDRRGAYRNQLQMPGNPFTQTEGYLAPRNAVKPVFSDNEFDLSNPTK